jgi:transposase-like protein
MILKECPYCEEEVEKSEMVYNKHLKKYICDSCNEEIERRYH